MADFDEWCEEEEKEINGHDLTLLTTDDASVEIGIEKLAAIVPEHFVAKDRYAHILGLLGKLGARDFLREKLPISKSIQSGDLGEVIAINYIEEVTIWDQTVKRLRWKDHRNMAMRGDDMIAVGIDDQNKTQILKGESKSSVKLQTSIVTTARRALNSHDGRPSPHALAFVSDRLYEEGRYDIADRINLAQQKNGLNINQVSHMLFTFTGNNSENFLTADLNNYTGTIDQFSVGLRVKNHQAFIKTVYEKALNGQP